jgi:hypothetical protein
MAGEGAATFGWDTSEVNTIQDLVHQVRDCKCALCVEGSEAVDHPPKRLCVRWFSGQAVAALLAAHTVCIRLLRLA